MFSVFSFWSFALVVALIVVLFNKIGALSRDVDNLKRELGNVLNKIKTQNPAQETTPLIKPADSLTCKETDDAQPLKTIAETKMPEDKPALEAAAVILAADVNAVKPEDIKEQDSPAVFKTEEDASADVFAGGAVQSGAEAFAVQEQALPGENLQPASSIGATDSAAPSKINLEMFAGAKLFAWIGGVAAFLALIFFIKYSIDNNLFTPQTRVIIGYVMALGALSAGVLIKNEALKTTRSVMFAIGITFIYISSYGGSIVYNLFPAYIAFIIMAAASGLSFFTAVIYDAKYAAVLGALGGYLTPFLLQTGGAKLSTLGTYFIILSVAALHVAVKKKWGSVFNIVSAASLLVLMAYHTKFLNRAATIDVAAFSFIKMGILTAYSYIASKSGLQGKSFKLIPSIAIVLSMFYVFANDYMYVVQMSYLLLLNAALLVLFWSNAYFKTMLAVGGCVAYTLLLYISAKPVNINTALCFYAAFAVVNTAAPLYKYYKERIVPGLLTGLYPCLLLLPVAISAFKADSVPAVLIIFIFGFFTLLFSVFRANLALSILSALATLIAVFVWMVMYKTTGFAVAMPVAFAALAAAFMYVNKKYISEYFGFFNAVPKRPDFVEQKFNTALKFIILMPYVMLVSFLLIKHPAAPHAFFTAGLFVTAIIYFISFKEKDGITQMLAVLGLFFIELFWFYTCYSFTEFSASCLWFTLLFAAFFIFPFIFKKHYFESKTPWYPAAFGGPLQFYLIYSANKLYFNSSDYLALIPAAFAVVYIAAAYIVHRWENRGEGVYNLRYGLFAAVGILFITLIFPILMDAPQWITVAWALEGAALVALFRHINLPALKYWAYGLLIVSFMRVINPCAINFAVAKGSILNWYLFLYPVVAASLYGAARLWQPKGQKLFKINCGALFIALGTVLLFILVNVEIAAYFADGSRLSFNFRGNFARDMSYTLSWGLFSIALFITGMLKHVKFSRVAGIALLAVTVLKLFLHDLWYLRQLYRVGALFGLAVILIVTAFMYQKYMAKNNKNENKN